MEFTVEQTNEAFTKLSKSLRRAIRDVDVAKAIQEVGKKYKMHIDALGVLETRVNWVLIGLIETRDLYRALREDLDLESKKVNQIIKDLNQKIFRPIREEYKSLKELEDRLSAGAQTPEEVGTPTPPEADVGTEELPRESALSLHESALPKADERILEQTGVNLEQPTTYDQQPTTEIESGKLEKREKEVLEETGMKIGRGEPIKIPTATEESGLDREKILAGVEVPSVSTSTPTPVFENTEKKESVESTPRKSIFEKQQKKLIEESKERGYGETDPYREEIG